tara:strand:+ start:93 stop:323 length:231 start_codon:yes stop_codon:yes gene_type:complete
VDINFLTTLLRGLSQLFYFKEILHFLSFLFVKLFLSREKKGEKKTHKKKDTPKKDTYVFNTPPSTSYPRRLVPTHQ